MKVTFLIKKTQITKEVPIEYRISSGIVKCTQIKKITDKKTGNVEYKELPVYHDIRRSTGLSIKSRFWNAKKQEANGSFEDANKINSRLSDIRNSIEKIQKNDFSDIEKLKAKIDSIVNGEPVSDKLNFFQFAENIKNNHNSLSRRKQFAQCLNVIKDFKQHTGYFIDFETVNRTFYDKFINYMNEIKKFATNTRHKHIRSLRYFMASAMEAGLHNNKAYNKFTSRSQQAMKIYLNDSELQKLFELNLTDNKRLEKIRDSFLIGCYTGLRFSDFSTLTKDNIIGNFIKVKTDKTNAFVVIPINPNLRTILDKYEILPSIRTETLIDNIQIIGKLAGIDTITQKYKEAGLVTTMQNVPKYELVTSHTARRSFATNCYKAGIPAKQIMLITGHKTESEFFKYIQISQEENAEMLLNHPHFSGAKLKVV